jgi:predicted RNase H-like HicB family nuclease
MSTVTAQRLTAILHREEEVYVAECPEVGTVSQGDTVEEALANLREATELFLEECPAAGVGAKAAHHLRGECCLSSRASMLLLWWQP